MAQRKEKSKTKTAIAEYIDRILDGTDAEAEEILRGFPEYKPIPEINMMTLPMISRLCHVPIGDNHLYNTTMNHGINVYAKKGRWGSGKESYGDIISISWYMQRAGMDISPSEGMKFIGVRIGNNVMNLYTARAVLAIMYASCRARCMVYKQVEEHYTEPTHEPAEIVEVSLAPHGATFSQEFVTELIRVCVRESVGAMLAFQAKQ